MRPVCAKMLVWLMLCSFLSASTQALIDMKERLKDRVVHVETLIHRGRWLWQNDNKDHGGSRYLFIDLIAERNTYYEPRVQFQVQLICVRQCRLNARKNTNLGSCFQNFHLELNVATSHNRMRLNCSEPLKTFFF